MILTLKKIHHKGAERTGFIFFATHLPEAGTDISHIQELPGHSSIKTTMIYTDITNKAINRIQRPLDRLNLKTDEKNDKKV